MSASRRKDLVREYKEKKAMPGIFAVRCLPTGATWTGASKNLETQQNGIWFQLRSGTHVNKVLQAAWNDHGADAFAFEMLEAIDDDNPGMVGLLLKEREAHWRAEIGAQKLVG
jgi:RimJ/RimL family protein N-acetyltransferase